jgi:hypothetical protein
VRIRLLRLDLNRSAVIIGRAGNDQQVTPFLLGISAQDKIDLWPPNGYRLTDAVRHPSRNRSTRVRLAGSCAS